MLRPDFTPSFVRDRKRCIKKHWDLGRLDAAMAAVAACDEFAVPERYRDHSLKGGWQGYRELHVDGKGGDWLLVYRIGEGTVTFVRTGSHDELFR